MLRLAQRAAIGSLQNIMAIYIGLKLKEQLGDIRNYTFFKSDGSHYGMIAVNMNTREIVLVHAEDTSAIDFAFTRACRAIERAWVNGDLPNELCYAA